jgi:hypothetical protein
MNILSTPWNHPQCTTIIGLLWLWSLVTFVAMVGSFSHVPRAFRKSIPHPPLVGCMLVPTKPCVTTSFLLPGKKLSSLQRLAQKDDDADWGDDEEDVVNEEEDLLIEEEYEDEDEVSIDDTMEFDDEEEDSEEDDDLVIEEELGSVPVVVAAEKTPQKDDATLDWNEAEDGVDYELVEDLDDPDFVQQKLLIDQAIAASEQRRADEQFDPLKFVLEDLTPEMAAALDELPLFQQVEAMAQDVMLTEEDVLREIPDGDLAAAVDDVSDLLSDDPYPRHAPDQINFLQENTGITDDDMIELDRTYKNVQQVLQTEPWDKVMVRAQRGLAGLTNETLAELDACLGELGGSAYNVTNWLLYDLDFNVSNLILAAVQHNREAPILFQHWYPQLVTYARYQHARDRNYDFTWADVEAANLTELEQYYAGFGYDSIPNKAPAETGIIRLEDLDEEDIKMAAFENWMTQVYNPEADRKDFDDDTMRDEDNVFSDFYEPPQHPDLPTLEDAVDDIEQWHAEVPGDDPEVRDYRNRLGQTFQYQVIRDEEFEREFRGHLIIACTADDQDLEIAERITVRFAQEFGKKVFVETRVMALARPEDNVYEIWLESYDIELLHSKKRATANSKGWTGPAEIDAAQLEYLTERVRFMISDDARYSYKLELDFAD